MYYVYVVRSKELDKNYVGYTQNLIRRLEEHHAGKSHTTRQMGTLQLVFYEAFLAQSDALRREKYFKTSKGRASLKQIIRDSILLKQ